MRREVGTIHSRGAELVVVGCGNRHFARVFREDVELATPLYVDTERASYRALGMKRGVLRTLNAGTFRNMWRSLRAGSRQKGVQGDPWQMGGVLVVLPDSRVTLRYLSAEAGDHPLVSDVLAALP